MKLNRTTKYAIAVMNALRTHGRQTTGDIVYNYPHLSETSLMQVTTRMRRAGYIRSFRGPGGGYELAGSTVTLKDLVDSFMASDKTFQVNGSEEYEQALADFCDTIVFTFSDADSKANEQADTSILVDESYSSKVH